LGASSSVRYHPAPSCSVRRASHLLAHQMTSETRLTPLPRNRSIPEDPVIPVLRYPDLSSATSWLCATFGFRERLRIGDHRVQLVIAPGGGAVVATDGGRMLGPTEGATHSIMVRVVSVDEHFERAKQAGAIIVSPPTTYPFGERQYSALDLAGHPWTFTETVEDVDPATWGGEWVGEWR